MSKVYLEDTNLINIANAIRSKNGETTTYKPSEMAEAIENIPSGGTAEEINDGLIFAYPFTTKPSSEYIDLSNTFTNGSYTFVEDNDLKVLKSDSNYNVNNGICYCYIKIDCTNTKAKISLKSYVNSESNYDFACVYYSNTVPTAYPSFSTIKSSWAVGGTNRYGTLLGKASGSNIRIDIETTLEDGIYYLVYGYAKDNSGNTGNDRYFIENIKIRIGSNLVSSNFNYAYKKYSNTTAILEAIKNAKDIDPNLKLNLYFCFDKSEALANQESIDAFNTYKDVFKNVISYKNLFGSSLSEIGSLCPNDFGTYFTVDGNTIDLYGMFAGLMKLTTIDVSKYKTYNVIDMGDLFYYCKGLTSIDLSNFDTSNVYNMSNMFYGCSGLTSIDLSNFDTSSCTNMGSMFSGCTKLTSIDISNFDTSSCTNMGSMFYNCPKLINLKLGSNFSPISSNIDMFGSDTSNNINIDMDGNTNFSSYSGAATFNLAKCWQGSASEYITLFESFANSLGTLNCNYTRTIKIYTTLYNALSSTQKALITDKGYALSYGAY